MPDERSQEVGEPSIPAPLIVSGAVTHAIKGGISGAAASES